MRALVVLLVLLFVPAYAGAQDGRASGPLITQGKGDKCVADTAYMRRYHMKELTHQRDETMHNGIRTKRFSLNECVACHANTGDDGKALPINAPGQFCSSCHEYSAVTIDCFQCHATKPDEKKQTSSWMPLPLTAAATPEATQ